VGRFVSPVISCWAKGPCGEERVTAGHFPLVGHMQRSLAGDGLDSFQEGGGIGPFRRPGHPLVGREPRRPRRMAVGHILIM
jgi:hypothetical protein